MESTQQKIDHCVKKLNEQVRSYPIKEVSIETIDQNLKKFVERHRNHLSKRNTKMLNKFQQIIANNQTFQEITTFYPTVDQVCSLKFSLLFRICLSISFRIYLFKNY